MNNTPHIILASKSSIRADLMSSVGVPFEIKSSNFDEEAYKPKIVSLTIPEQAIKLAEKKALSVSDNFPESIVIGADQICEIGNQILSKPKGKEKALIQLNALSNKTHQLHSSVCIVKNSNVVWSYCQTSYLTMRALSNEEIETYLDLDSPYESCGSYRFEGYGRHLFSKFEGDYDSILGLPLVPLLSKLHEEKYISLIDLSI